MPQENVKDVLVVIPTYNEQDHIETCLRSLLNGGFERGTVIVCDGGSQDATREIVTGLKAEFPNVELLHNEKKLQSAAINLAVSQAATSETKYLVRCDAHSIYPDHYIADIVSKLEETGAASVVTAMDSVGSTCFEKANAWIVDTPLGSGGAAHRGGARSGYVDHGHHAGFDIDWFRRIGGYDESFSHNEDAEYDLRLTKAGGDVYLDADIRSIYTPRGSVSSLAKQYFNYGKGRARTVLKHAVRPKIRQMLPVFAVLAIFLSLVLLPVAPVFAIIPLTYLAVLITVSLCFVLLKVSLCGLWTGPALGTMHLSWGLGFLVQLFRNNLGQSAKMGLQQREL